MNPQSIKNKVKDAADLLGVTFNEAFHRIAMERFLARLASSPHGEKFVFKGGSLLSYYYDLGRETRDLDFLLTNLKADKPIVEQSLEEIASIDLADGFLLKLAKVSDLVHDHMKYGGFQAKINVTLAQMREAIEIDVGVGDFVNPRMKNVKLMQGKGKPIFEDEISLLVYPPETILAEKLHTAVARREQNSRMKDYYDIFTILNSGASSIETNREAIIATFRHREMSISTLPLIFTDIEIQTLQKYWSVFHKAIKNKDELSMEIKQIIASINLGLSKLGFK